MGRIGVPPQEELEPDYEPAEIDFLNTVRKVTEPIRDTDKKCSIGRALLRKLWPDELLFISKTHHIRTKRGRLELLKPNYAQRRFYEVAIASRRRELQPMRAIILKARQLGFSTFLQSWFYENLDRSQLQQSLTVSYDNESTTDLFSKAKLVHDCMWFPRPTERSSRKEITFKDNRSSFKTRTQGNMAAGRGETFQKMHLSELPMWSNDTEVLTGLFQCVPMEPETFIGIESTARGAVGEFYDGWQAAEKGESDYTPFFAPWFWDEQYTQPFGRDDTRNHFMRKMSKEDRAYMRKHNLSPEQMNWRSWKIRNDLQGSVRKFRQEFPAEPMEAFLTTGNPAFDPDKVSEMFHYCTEPLERYEIITSGHEANSAR